MGTAFILKKHRWILVLLLLLSLAVITIFASAGGGHGGSGCDTPYYYTCYATTPEGSQFSCTKCKGSPHCSFPESFTMDYCGVGDTYNIYDCYASDGSKYINTPPPPPPPPPPELDYSNTLPGTEGYGIATPPPNPFTQP